ncbi:MAG: small basic protein [Candidatus Omnitrophota bacterium]|jgi:small basic protein (TIGR04137 family)
MSIHPSLKLSDKNNKQRSVLKRIERLKLMAEKNSWKEGEDVFGLPKIKTVRIKIKKEKVEKAETAAGTPAAGDAKAAAPAAKGAAPAAKGAAAKAPEKK